MSFKKNEKVILNIALKKERVYMFLITSTYNYKFDSKKM